MTTENPGNAPDTSAPNTNESTPGNAAETSAPKMIPKNRFDEVVNQRNEAQAVLKTLADAAMAEVPEEFRDLVPEKLAPQDQILWIQRASKKGLFGNKEEKPGLDTKRPGGKPASNFEGLSPQAMMSQGYQSTK